MTLRKEVLLDIDGVIHPLGSMVDNRRVIDFQGWQNTWIPEHLDDIVNYMLTRQTRWASTWEDISNEINKSYNLPPIGYLKIGEYIDDTRWIKEKAILDYIRSRWFTKFLLIDDEVPADSVLYQEPRLSIITPDGLLGLSEKEVEKIKNFY